MEVKKFMKNDITKYALILSVLLIILSLVLFKDISFLFLGIAISIIGCIILYKINH